MNIPFLDLPRQYQNIKQEIDAAVKRVMKRQFFILGDELKGFEKSFADYLKSPYCCGVASGTDGLVLALKMLDIGTGDEVIVPAQTFIATALAVSEVGAVPIFADIDPDTYQIDPRQIEAKISDRTKAVIPVHLYGAPCAIKEIVRLCRRHGVKVVEDACQAHGARANGKAVGTFGDAGVFSFYPGKNLGAYGDGGAVCVKSSRNYKKLCMLRNYGQKEKYIHEQPGGNSRLDEIQAAVLKVKLKYLSLANRQRNVIAGLYREGLKDIVKFQKVIPGTESCCHLFVVETENRDGLLQHLKRRRIQTLIHYPRPLHLQKRYRELKCKIGEFPVAEKQATHVLSLPIFPELRRQEVDYVIKAVREFYG